MRAFVTCLVVFASISGLGLAVDLTIELPGGVTMDFNYIPPGTFMMGSPEDERGRYDWEDLHQVTLTKGYFVGVTEVTQGQWEAVLGTIEPSTGCAIAGLGSGPDYPVCNVCWADITGPGQFLGLLNAHLAATGQPGAGLFRLPTEAEWERAARGGTQTEFSFAVPPDWETVCGEIPEAEPHMVWCGHHSYHAELAGSKQPNQYGLHEMHGNQWEWVQDRLQDRLGFDTVTDPTGPETGPYRVIRGGAWYYIAQDCRSASRFGRLEGDRNALVAFRLARSADGNGVFANDFETGDTTAWSTTVQ